jgi:Zn-finger nucleic acid-binding protein
LVLFGVVPAVSGLWLDGGELPSVMRWVCALAAAISFAMLMLAWRGYSAMRRDGSAAVAGDAGQS